MAVLIIVVSVLALVAAAPAQPSGQGWEYINLLWTDAVDVGEGVLQPAYTVCRTSSDCEAFVLPVSSAANVTDALNSLGAEGWELVTVQFVEMANAPVPVNSYILKRRL